MSQPPWPPRPQPPEEPSSEAQPYGQQGYGRTAYGQPYGPPGYGQPGYGSGYPPPWPGPWSPVPPHAPAPGLSRRAVAALVAGGLLLVAALGAGVFLLFSMANGGQVTAPPATLGTAGLGEDPWLDQLAEDCHDGDMAACDDLFVQSELDSRYETYGDTCAGRRGGGEWSFCTDDFSDSTESPSA
jgi:hypothetical protein